MERMAGRAEYLGPERRRPLVLDAALEIFAEGGFAEASMQAVAERAGVSKAVLYDCFPGGKQEIYYALLERGERTFLDHMAGVLDRTAGLPLDQALRQGLLAFLDYAELHPKSFRVIFGAPGTADPEIARRTERVRERIIEQLARRTRALMREAGLEAGPLADVFPRSIVAVAEELARWVAREPDLPRDSLVELVVAWFMKGFERLIPNEAWRRGRPAPPGEAGGERR
jgi:AcrR family transcriptional regulator